MGVWDYPANDDDFVFPDFDSSFAPPQSKENRSNSEPGKTKAQENADSSSTTTTTSSSSSSSKRSEPSPPRDRGHRSSSSASMAERPLGKTRHSRSKSFDLYGEDKELQEAEPTL